MRLFFDLFADGKRAVLALSPTARCFHIFWLLGPFFMLIERTTGDVYISIIALAFVVKSIKQRECSWLKLFWVRSSFAFWGVCLLSAGLSTDPLYALGEAFVWIRFPIFAMAIIFWLGTDKRLIYLMLILTASAILLMCGILTAEIAIEGFKTRLSWPYDDLVPGNYLAKVGLPVVVCATALAMSRNIGFATLAALFILICLIFVVLTGERINALILIFGAGLTGVLWMKNSKRMGIGLGIGIISVIVLLQLYPQLTTRFVTTFIDQLPTGEHSAYYRAMLPAIWAFEQSPLLGIGTANFRNLCPELVVLAPQFECHPHPHNYYVQMLGETGIIGFIFGTICLWSIFWTCFSAGRKQREDVVLGTAWVVPFALFWPITSSADFFGQWNNIFMWSSVALALATTNLRKS